MILLEFALSVFCVVFTFSEDWFRDFLDCESFLAGAPMSEARTEMPFTSGSFPLPSFSFLSGLSFVSMPGKIVRSRVMPLVGLEKGFT